MPCPPFLKLALSPSAYLPRTDRQSHYFEVRLAGQFDAAVFFDRSAALTPLRR